MCRPIAEKTAGAHNLRLFSPCPELSDVDIQNFSNSLGNSLNANPPALKPILPFKRLLGLREHLLHKFAITQNTLIALLQGPGHP